tara:strand:- start:61 stop:441 length:381 start_codon:yes stop_codon:yes gene_type:complete
MARWTYYKSNSDYNEWHRQFEGLAGIDVDFIECCPKCYEPLAIKETCFDKGQEYKATTFVNMLGNRLQIPVFLVFYRLDDLGVMNLRVQRVRPFKSQIQPMSVEKWTGILYDLQAKHKEVCRYEKD